jgi:hypothetical protein
MKLLAFCISWDENRVSLIILREAGKMDSTKRNAHDTLWEHEIVIIRSL